MACINVSSGVTTLSMDVSQYSGLTITVDSAATYDVRYCGDYAFYYANRYGGWDSFLCEGNGKRTDKITSYDYERPADRNSLRFGRQRYMNEVSETWEVNTGWLTDRQAEILADNLLESTTVYMHLLADDRIVPVILEDKTVEYKKHRTEGKMVNYKIKVASAQTFIRR